MVSNYIIMLVIMNILYFSRTHFAHSSGWVTAGRTKNTLSCSPFGPRWMYDDGPSLSHLIFLKLIYVQLSYKVVPQVVSVQLVYFIFVLFH